MRSLKRKTLLIRPRAAPSSIDPLRASILPQGEGVLPVDHSFVTFVFFATFVLNCPIRVRRRANIGIVGHSKRFAMQ